VDDVPTPPLGFDDAFPSTAAKTGVFFESTIVSFDTAFDASDIIRLEPSGVKVKMGIERQNRVLSSKNGL
jgi:hypothetical protein